MWITKNARVALHWQGKESASNGSYFFDFLPIGISILHVQRETTIYLYFLFVCLTVILGGPS